MIVAMSRGRVARFLHSALFYRSQREYLGAVMPFVLDGLRNGEPVLVAVPTDNLAMVRDELGDACAKVTMADLVEVGRNPARVMAVMNQPLPRNTVTAGPG